MQQSYIMLRHCWASSFRTSSLGPVYHPDRASPLPYLRGEAYGLAGSAQPGPQLSPPSQLPTPESQAEQSGGPLETLERVTVRGRGIHGQEPTYCVHSLSLSQSLSHYFTRPSPILTYLFIFYTPTHWLCSSHFSFLLHPPVFRHVSLLPSPSWQQLSNSSPQQTLHAQFNKVKYDNNHIVYTCIMRWKFQQTKQSQHKHLLS